MCDVLNAVDARMREIDFTYLYDKEAANNFGAPGVNTLGLRIAVRQGERMVFPKSSGNCFIGDNNRVNRLRLAEISQEVRIR